MTDFNSMFSRFCHLVYKYYFLFILVTTLEQINSLFRNKNNGFGSIATKSQVKKSHYTT